MNPDLGLTHAAIRLAINLLLLGSSVAVGVALAFRLTRMASPRARYVIGIMAFLIAALAPLAATFYNVRAQGSAKPSTTLASKIDRVVPEHSPAAPSFPPIKLLQPPITTTARLDTLVDALANSFAAGWFLKLWGLVTGLLLSREIIWHLRLTRARHAWSPATTVMREKLAWPHTVALYLHEQAGPSTVGLLHPAVVLPERLWETLPRAAVMRIAQHELAHARWRDPLIHAALRVVCAILWPSLPLWFLSRIIRIEREAAADRAALSFRTSSAEAQRIAADYAASLILVAGWSARETKLGDYGLVSIPASSEKGLEDRIHRVLEVTARPTCGRLICGGVILLAGLYSMSLLPTAAQAARSNSRGAIINQLHQAPSVAMQGTSKAHLFNFASTSKRESLARAMDPLIVSSGLEADKPDGMQSAENLMRLILIGHSNYDWPESAESVGGVEQKIVSDDSQEPSQSNVAADASKAETTPPETHGLPDTSGQWKYLGQGIWQDPLGNRVHPDAPKPWKDLGNGFWEDGEGRRVAAQALPAWVYLGEGKWYTPRMGDWMKNLSKAALTKLGLQSEDRPLNSPDNSNIKPVETQPQAVAELKKQPPESDSRKDRIVNRIKIVNR